MELNKFERLLKKEEHSKLDFKEEFHIKTENEKKELAKDVIAMANTKGGRGYIIFGVEDETKKITGIDPSLFHEETIQQIINSRSHPPIPISVQQVIYENKVLVLLIIYKSELKPHQMIQNGSFYIRRGSTTDVATREEIASMLQENGLFSYERVLLPDVSMDAMNIEILEKYFYKDDRLWEALGIVGEHSNGLCPTIGGLLLFGKRPQDYLPHTYIELNYKGEKKVLDGSIKEILGKAEEFLRNECPNIEYPIEQLVEVIGNALIHRDYLDGSRGITVDITSKNIIICNPGSLVEGNKIYRGRVVDNPKRRNPWLYQRAVLVDDQKRFFQHEMGMEKVHKAFKPFGKVKYINLSSRNLFKVILPSWK